MLFSTWLKRQVKDQQPEGTDWETSHALKLGDLCSFQNWPTFKIIWRNVKKKKKKTYSIATLLNYIGSLPKVEILKTRRLWQIKIYRENFLFSVAKEIEFLEAESYTLQQYFTCNRNEFISEKGKFYETRHQNW